MAFLTWDKTYETGIPVIDNQHRKLFDLINALQSAMQQGKSKEVLEKTLIELKSYTQYHFATEGKAFQKYNYSQTGEHLRKHSDLIKELDSITDQFKKGKALVSVTLLDFLTKWLKEHIMQLDMKYVSTLKDKEIEE